MADRVITVPQAVQIAQATKGQLNDLNERLEELECGGTGGLTADVKAALLACFSHVAWDSADPTGQSYISALQTALYPPANLSSISAVFTQSGTVWTTDTLDSLKTNLVVTAYYTDNTHEVISDYTLSGTLSEGTRTITAAYGGKTATFTVVVSEYSTAPVIMTEGVVWSKTPPNTVSKEGFGITKWYDYTFSQENIESSRYWDETNQYMSTSGWSGIVIYTPDTNTYEEGYTWPASSNFKHVGGLDGVYTNNTSITRNSVINWSFNRYSAVAVTNNGVSFSIPLLDADDCYAYWHSSAAGAIYPEGVSDGDIIFAGQNTPYFGMHNISEAET